MVSIEGLCEQHRQLSVIARRMLAIVAAPVADAAAVAGCRWRLAHMLLDHCMEEDRGVYDRLMASGDAAATALAWRFRAELGMLGQRYSRYIADWPVDRINRDWSGFRADTQAIMAVIAARIACEERDLYPHVDRIQARCRAA